MVTYDALATIDITEYKWHMKPYRLSDKDIRIVQTDFVLRDQYAVPLLEPEVQIWPRLPSDFGLGRGRGGGRRGRRGRGVGRGGSHGDEQGVSLPMAIAGPDDAIGSHEDLAEGREDEPFDVGDDEGLDDDPKADIVADLSDDEQVSSLGEPFQSLHLRAVNLFSPQLSTSTIAITKTITTIATAITITTQCNFCVG